MVHGTAYQDAMFRMAADTSLCGGVHCSVLLRLRCRPPILSGGALLAPHKVMDKEFRLPRRHPSLNHYCSKDPLVTPHLLSPVSGFQRAPASELQAGPTSSTTSSSCPAGLSRSTPSITTSTSTRSFHWIPTIHYKIKTICGIHGGGCSAGQRCSLKRLLLGSTHGATVTSPHGSLFSTRDRLHFCHFSPHQQGRGRGIL